MQRPLRRVHLLAVCQPAVPNISACPRRTKPPGRYSALKPPICTRQHPRQTQLESSIRPCCIICLGDTVVRAASSLGPRGQTRSQWTCWTGPAPPEGIPAGCRPGRGPVAQRRSEGERAERSFFVEGVWLPRSWGLAPSLALASQTAPRSAEVPKCPPAHACARLS